MSSRSRVVLLRLKYILDRYGTLVLAVLLLTSAAGFAGAALAYTAPPETEQVTEQTDEQSFTTTLNTSAAVTDNTTLYRSDRRLSNMPVYLIGASPEVTIEARTEVPDDRAVKVTQQITLELSATRDGEAFWSETRTLASQAKRVTDGDLVTETTVDVREIRRDRLDEIRSELGRAGNLQVTVHVDTVYEAGKYQGSLAVTAPTEIRDRVYTIDAPQSDERSHATSVTRTTTDSGAQITVGTPLSENATGVAGTLSGLGQVTVPKDSALRGALGAVALIVTLVTWRVYSRLPDRSVLERAYDRARYSEWISRGRIPVSGSREQIPVESLADLIDVAIDSNKRIIHDPQQSRYVVLDGRVAYVYDDAGGQSGSGVFPSDSGPRQTDEEGSRGGQDTQSGTPITSDGGEVDTGSR